MISRPGNQAPYLTRKNPSMILQTIPGLKELPPFQSSLIWYSYDESEEFPWVATGGKNPMAGPVFYKDAFPDAKQRFPDYFDNKLIIYEWMRHWIYVVKLDEEGHFIKADPFMPSNELKRPMDMVFGKDGALYMIEYGMQWFARNPGARLSKIEYISGNRAPIARISADKTVGAAPLTVSFSGSDSEDLDGDRIKYEWTFEGSEVQDQSAFPIYTFERPGTYQVKLRVTDPSGLTHQSGIDIQVGNQPPEVAWKINGNQSLYWNDGQIDYQVLVEDKEDGSTANGSIPADRVKVNIDYLQEGYDLTVIAQGHQMAEAQPRSPIARGAQLVGQSDCRNCHAEKIKINGPSYLDIAKRYGSDPQSVDTLAQKILAGGGGNWGETAMSAHPQLSLEQAEMMVQYILSLTGSQSETSTFPIAGTYPTNQHDQQKQEGVYVLMATYSDGGNGNIASITKQNSLVLRAARFQAERQALRSEDTERARFKENEDCLGGLTHNQYVGVRDIDLTGIAHITLNIVVKSAGSLEIHLDKPDGLLVSSQLLSAKADELQQIDLPLELRDTTHDIYLVFKNTENSQVDAMLDWLFFGRGENTQAPIQTD